MQLGPAGGCSVGGSKQQQRLTSGLARRSATFGWRGVEQVGQLVRQALLLGRHRSTLLLGASQRLLAYWMLPGRCPIPYRLHNSRCSRARARRQCGGRREALGQARRYARIVYECCGSLGTRMHAMHAARKDAVLSGAKRALQGCQPTIATHTINWTASKAGSTLPGATPFLCRTLRPSQRPGREGPVP